MAAQEAQGVVIARGDGASPEVFTTIPGVTGFNGPGGQAAVIDITTLQSTAKEKLVGLRDEGQISLDTLFDYSETQHAGLVTDRDNRTLRNFRITLTDSPATVIDFAGYVLGLPISGSVDEAVQGTVTIEISGALTWT